MNDALKGLLGQLKALSVLDLKIAQILAERRRLEKDHKDKLAQIHKLEKEKLTTAGQLEEKRRYYSKEERRLKDERSKLDDRRKGLATLSSYKHQQAAEREIDHAITQLSDGEDVLLGMLGQIDVLDGAAKKIEETLGAAQKALAAFELESKETLAGLAEREARNRQERAEIASQVDKVQLQTYERIRDKFPDSALAQVIGGNCASCFMQVGAQMLVQMSRGDALIRCRGCGRILFLEETKEE